MQSTQLACRELSSHYPESMRMATFAFVAIWLVIAGFTMWVGVAKAGYSVAEELPILVLNFALPAAVVILLKWKML